MKVDDLSSSESKEPLITELSYIISRLHKDMYVQSQIPLVHLVGIPNATSVSTSLDCVCIIYLLTQIKVVSFAACIQAHTRGHSYVELDGEPCPLANILPNMGDMGGFVIIPNDSLTITSTIGKVLFL